VDPIACDGYGHCAEIAGEIISLDEWGYPIISDADVPGRMLEIVDMAIKQCPRRALFLAEAPRRR
jgi:ferredoxin